MHIVTGPARQPISPNSRRYARFSTAYVRHAICHTDGAARTIMGICGIFAITGARLDEI
jgi:hypothetical protein